MKKTTTTELNEAQLNNIAAAGVAGTVYKIIKKTAPLVDEKLSEPQRKYECHYKSPTYRF